MPETDTLAQVPGLVLATDAAGKVTFASDRLLSFIGCPASTIVGRSILAVGAASLARAGRRAVVAAMVAADERPLQLAWVCPDGERRIVEAVIAPRRDAGGRLGGHVAIGMDVTAARRRDERLAVSRRLDAIGRFSRGIAHAVNNALTVIMGSVDIATQRMRHGESPEAELGEIMQAGRKTSALVRQLQLVGGRGQPPSAPLDLSRLIESLVPTFHRIFGTGIAVDTDLPEEVWPVLADAPQMEQALLCLAANAREAMSDGGRFSIVTENRAEAARGATPCGWDASRAHVVLRVRDTGRGMDESALGRLFEPFFTTKKDSGSTGMGLATVHGIVRRSGGCIEVDSAPGRGTEFRILLPRFVERPAAAAAADDGPAPSGRGERVLVVEDDARLLDTIAAVLGRHGYRVAGTTTAERALEIAAVGRHRFDLILADLILPGMTGVELRDRLQTVDPSLRVMMMSGCREDAVRGLTAIAQDGMFLQKPFGNAALLGSVRAALDDRWRAACA